MFGVFAYVVEQRTREIGIRMALGARPAQVIGAVLRASMRSVLLGLVFGFAAAAGAAQLIRSHLYGLGTLDPPAYLLVAVLIFAAAMCATFLPARRAARVDPVAALRHE
jgi:ABC-type antimicrobial peptide transport system permease subunit